MSFLKKLFVLATGGTIEKTYNEQGGYIENKVSLVKPRLLKHLRLPHLEVDVIKVMSKDSLDMNDVDREKIRSKIESLNHFGSPIIVIHGTDTMEVSAKYCFEMYPEVDVPVVFTGAMKPAGFSDSDAIQNFTEALYASQIVSKGYYISFHGQLFNVPNVRKNKELGTFEIL